MGFLTTYTLSIQVCPEKGINPTILLWGWDWDHQTYSREGYGSLGTSHEMILHVDFHTVQERLELIASKPFARMSYTEAVEVVFVDFFFFRDGPVRVRRNLSRLVVATQIWWVVSKIFGIFTPTWGRFPI